ncbi:MAG: histidinol-phosphatase [Ktedonobacterales bacterium]|nr:histidinol-phosphatase [Ktedonobacterales bacterium]
MATPTGPTLPTNYHTHSRYCDGQGEIEDYVRAAIAQGMTSLGISSHAPVPFANGYALRPEKLDAYVAEVRRLQAAHAGQIAIALGTEVDVIPGIETYFAGTILTKGFDYFIGSVHFVGTDPHTGDPWEFDAGPDHFAAGLNDWYEGDFRRLAEDFYAIARTVPHFIPGIAIVGHMDRIKRFNYDNQYFSEDAPWYRELVEGALSAYAEAGTIVELNTAGWRTRTGAPFPSPWITSRCHELGIRMTINTDAHQPTPLQAGHPQAIAQLRAAGYREVWVLRQGAWVAEALPE